MLLRKKMRDFFESDLDRINEAIADGTVFHSVVKKLGFENEVPYMTVQVAEENGLQGGYVGYIYIDESDDEMTRRSLMPLLNQEIPFVIIGISRENGHVICSRKRAQQAIKARMMPDFEAGRTFRAKIVKFMDFGAFVEINGISGVLRTTDFSSDHSEVSEYYNIGDRVEVVCKEVGENGRIVFRALHTHARKEPIQYDLEEGQILMGKVRSLRNFERGAVAFVRIATGLDCLCPMPDEMEIEKEAEVAVRIREIKESDDTTKPPFVRGKIVRVY